MAVETYIVTVEDFTNRANISSNLLTARFKMESGINQEMFARKILCQEQYDVILTEIAGTLSAANALLVPFLKDYLVYKIYADYLVDGNLIFTASGARTQADTTSDVPSDKAMAMAINKAEGRANYYQDQLVNFLTCNKDDYPLWRDSVCGCGKTRTEKNNQFSMVGKTVFRDGKIDWT